MKDHEMCELVDKLTAVAKKYHDTQQLREQIAHCIRPLHDDPYAELKAAVRDQNKEIRVNNADHTGRWESGYDLDWILPPEDYEIRDKPKPKVKMWQWIYQGADKQVYTTARFFQTTPTGNFKWIGPALWTEIEVEL
jgi:hypothetical protein